MNWKPLLCVAALALAAGCKSQQNPYASLGEYGFSYDLAQYPVPGLTVAENDRISRTPAAPPTLLWAPAAPAVIVAPVPVKKTVMVTPETAAPAVVPEVVVPVAPAPAPESVPVQKPTTPTQSVEEK
ncbi:MAG TPA: hypothetical protein VHB20_10640 [Verrucomicrobiae bacterium]|jgi:hypothetical protein|nr:hypothetical protein [Verrucomicrobiae bacterium]